MEARGFRLLGILFILIVLIGCSGLVVLAEPEGDCWQIDYSTNFAGHIKVTFCDQAIATKLEKFGVTVIASAPKWNSFVYNAVNKRYMEVSSEQFRTSKFIEKLLRRQLEKATRAQAEFTHKAKSIEGFQASQMLLKERNAAGELEESSEVWVTPNLNVPSQFKQFLQIALGVAHEIDGTPLQISVMQKGLDDRSHHLVQALIAYRISKVPRTGAFDAMPGYKKVNTEINLLTADDTK
ncbi:MAG TPA: hypothetical protein V6C97_08950 [Oculatellaceae cyanobacterium]